MYVNDGKVSGTDFWSIENASNNGFLPHYVYITTIQEVGDSEIDTKTCIFISDNGLITTLAGKGHGRVKTIGKYYEIILTNDPKLIEDGVQAIDDEFLRWFIKNPTCEFVEVENNWEFLGDDYRRGGEQTLVYKIIIPQEEPKQKNQDYIDDCFRVLNGKNPIYEKETVEEAAKKYKDLNLPDDLYDAFIQGAKWQAEQLYKDDTIKTLEMGMSFLLQKIDKMYIDEEVLEIIKGYDIYQWDESSFNGKDTLTLEEWFNKFKKK